VPDVRIHAGRILERLADRHTARHSTQNPQNSQNKTGFLCAFREFCVDRRGYLDEFDSPLLKR
jgi:hypothetical protein